MLVIALDRVPELRNLNRHFLCRLRPTFRPLEIDIMERNQLAHRPVIFPIPCDVWDGVIGVDEARFKRPKCANLVNDFW